MIEFEKKINQSEYNAAYLNLTDDRGNTHGREFNLDHGVRVAIVGNSGQVTFAQKHKNNQIWGGLKHWYEIENAVPGSKIRVRFDPAERNDGLPVIQLITEEVGTIAPPASWTNRRFTPPKSRYLLNGSSKIFLLPICRSLNLG